MGISEVLAPVAAVLLSVGGAGAIIVAVGNTLGKLWADRSVQSYIARNQREIESLKESLRRGTEGELEMLARKRNVYARLATSMRIFIRDGEEATQDQRVEFLNAYAECYLWASEAVVEAMSVFIDLNRIGEPSGRPRDVEQRGAELQEAYEACLVAMREDSGYPNTSTRYRIIHF